MEPRNLTRPCVLASVVIISNDILKYTVSPDVVKVLSISCDQSTIIYGEVKLKATNFAYHSQLLRNNTLILCEVRLHLLLFAHSTISWS